MVKHIKILYVVLLLANVVINLIWAITHRDQIEPISQTVGSITQLVSFFL